MTSKDRKLAQAVANAMPADPASPSFTESFEAAAIRAGRRRHRIHLLAAAAVAALAVIVLLDKSGVDAGPGYIEIAELMGTTSWTAPSDTLLPDSRFDIYQDLPTLMESTEANGGTLL